MSVTLGLCLEVEKFVTRKAYRTGVRFCRRVNSSVSYLPEAIAD